MSFPTIPVEKIHNEFVIMTQSSALRIPSIIMLKNPTNLWNNEGVNSDILFKVCHLITTIYT